MFILPSPTKYPKLSPFFFSPPLLQIHLLPLCIVNFYTHFHSTCCHSFNMASTSLPDLFPHSAVPKLTTSFPHNALSTLTLKSTTHKALISTSTLPQQTTQEFKENHYIKLLSRSCKAGKYSESLYFLEYMVSKGHQPDVFLCTKLIKGLFGARSPEKALRVMDILEAHGRPDVFSYNALVTGLTKLNQFDRATDALPRMRSRGVDPDIVTYNILIGALCSKGMLDSARNVLDQLLNDDDCRPSVITYTILIEAALLEGGIHDALKLLHEMEDGGLKPDGYTYNAILRGMCKEGFVDEARDFVFALPDPDVMSFNIVLRGFLSRTRWEDGQRLISEMVSRGHKLNNVTYSILINSLCNEGMVDRARELVEDMVGRGLRPDTYNYDPLISAYCKEGRLDLAVGFMDYMISNGCVPDIINYNTILAALCKSGNPDHAVEVLGKLHEITGCSPNVSSYNALIGGLWSAGNRTKALEMVTAMMENGTDPDEITYNVLISCLCRDGMVNEAIGLLRDMEGGGLRPSVITYNTVVLGLCKARRLCTGINVLEEMVAKGVRPNETTYIVLVEGIAYAGERSVAMELARELVGMGVFLDGNVKRLCRTFPMLNSYKDVARLLHE